MSHSGEFSLAKAQAGAEKVVQWLAPYCHRVEVVGSIRRLQPVVHDLEILADPMTWFEWEMSAALNAGDTFALRTVNGTANGQRYKRLWFRDGGDYWPVDLFLCLPPAQYGWLKVLRTGSSDWNQKYLLWRKPPGLMARNGALYCNNILIPTPDEAEVFAAFGRSWVDPQDREV